ncbi:MAG: ATP-dependent DNA helicase [Methanoculleaceae archaeon]
MDALDDWFPYPGYRPHQREMLEAVLSTAREGGILMIDAPTGSGKSSTVTALLAGARGRKVVVAVRTISQLDTFLRELSLVRRRKKDLKCAYLIGKGAMCPLGGEGDVYRRCEGVRAFSTQLMLERARRGASHPAKDPVIRRQIEKMDHEHPLICPYFIYSRTYTESRDGTGRIGLSGALLSRATQLSTRMVPPDELKEFCGNLCPYEVMLAAGRDADVLLVNFYHIFDQTIREQLFAQLGLEEKDTLLLIDEAHNCGDVIQSIQSRTVRKRDVEQAIFELSSLRSKKHGVTESLSGIIGRVGNFMDMLKDAPEREDWFDPEIFYRSILGESLYGSMDEVVEDLLDISESIREKEAEQGNFRETAIERFTEFFYRVLRAGEDPTYLTIYRIEEDGVALEVQSIDPGPTIQEIAGSHAACVLISGSLSPIEQYRRYYFGTNPVATLTLPNTFPEENRRLLVASDITSTWRSRNDGRNVSRITEYIRTFSKMPGNLAVYFPSYDMLSAYAERLQDRISGKEVFVEPRTARDATLALSEFLDLPEKGRSGILLAVCGGKWSEGLDYRGDLLSGALVIGLPLAPYTPVRRLIIRYFRMKFGKDGEFISYSLPAINRAIQAIGRVIRTPEDRGLLVLGDRRFLSDRIRSALPQWMQEELVPCDIARFREEVAAWQ